MSHDWKALAPHRPLEPGASSYVAPSSGGAGEIAEWILAGSSTVLVGGPTGIGRSTELAQAASILQRDRVPCFVPIDRFENVRRLTPDRLLHHIVREVALVAIQNLELPVSIDLKLAVFHAGVLDHELFDRDQERRTVLPACDPSRSPSPLDLARNMLNEVARLSSQRRVVLLIDGLEKVPPGPGSLEPFDVLGALPEDVDLVLAVPWHLAFGRQSEQVVRPGERFVMLRASEVEGDVGAAGREFLRDMLLQRMPSSAEALEAEAVVEHLRDARRAGRDRVAAHRELVMEAAKSSGGVSRTFLQLMADAGTYAQLRGAEYWPDASDLADAQADHQDSFRRVLLPGDAAAILSAVGTDGRELDLARKVRLLAHGVLLERLRDRRPVLEIHPLARAVVDQPEANHA